MAGTTRGGAEPGAGPLGDLRVVDLSTLVAGPACARYLADFGADVVKVERPGAGDGARTLGWRHPDDDVTLWWKLAGRNKRCIELDLKSPADRDRFLDLCATADVLVESFRPGTLERLGIGPAVLLERRATLVVTRVSGFGQTGPYSPRPGFATLAEGMSGFAAINGTDRPTLPPIALTDELAGLAAAFATLVAVRSGVGQVVDVNLLESMLQVLGPLPSASALLGYDQPRLAGGVPYSVPRNCYRTADDRWVAISTSSEPVATRLLELVGLDGDDRLTTSAGRAANRDEVDEAVAAWTAQHSLDEAMAALQRADVAAAPVLTVTELLADPHVAERQSVTDLDGTPMQGLVARLSATPGALRWAGRAPGADTREVLDELG